jgi:hypothetical protein
MEQATCPKCGATLGTVDGLLLAHGLKRRGRVTWCIGSGEAGEVVMALLVQLGLLDFSEVVAQSDRTGHSMGV